MPLKTQYFKAIGFFLVLFPLMVSAQEVRPVTGNPVLKKLSKETAEKRFKSAQDVHQSASVFFDDFSDITFYPDPSKWLDNTAYINADYAVDPISYGVATLDAIDENGDVYPVSETPSLCDSLTSIPFNLDPDSTYFLSFFYQPQGLGEAPEAKDSLVVEFSRDGKWYRVWSTPGTALQPFKQQIIAVPDTLNSDGFRFRFRNYASFSADELIGGAGALSNFDQWHIDYVRFGNSADFHPEVYDVNVINTPASSFETYQSIPWSHVEEALFRDLRHIMPIRIRTNDRPPDEDASTAIDRGIFIRNAITGEFLQEANLAGTGENFEYDSVFLRNDFFTSPLNSITGAYADVEIGVVIRKEGMYNFHGNDTVIRLEKYRDYYAYDDGSPEMGFGLSGESVSGSFLVQRFTLFKSDYIRRIDIYFNKVLGNTNAENGFQICVWNSVNGQPGELLYPDPDNEAENRIFFPDTSNVFEFESYLLERPVLVSDEAFVGIILRSNNFLNIGYDLNTSNRDKIFYNISGDWKPVNNSAVPAGSLMLRPAFSESSSGINNPKLQNISLQIFPNPAGNYIQFKMEDQSLSGLKITITNAAGNLVYSDISESNRIDISQLHPGLYILNAISEDGKRYTGKFSKF